MVKPMADITIHDGYTARYYKKDNRIVINLPQTMVTMTNTIEPVVSRKVEISEEELSSFVALAKLVFEGRNET